MMQRFNQILRHSVITAVGFFVVNLASFTTAQAAERIMVVLDGSGSMWGQIDGKPKLEIARETLHDVLQSVPESTELGLISYGHREKGNCDDIELIVSPAVGTAALIISEVNSLKFLGKTPLTAAVKMAAAELRYTEDKATVVLITDGIETCDADICEAGASLESQGVDFTAHVVGFGLSDEEGQQVACLAENTGGQYFSANDADSLVVALTETITVALPEQSATLEAPETAPAGSEIKVVWTGPENKNDYIAIVEVGAEEGKHIDYAYTRRGSPAKLTMPDATGPFELRYVVSATKRTLASREIVLMDVEATLDAPETAPAGSEIQVAWTGPENKNDYIAIAEMGAGEGTHINYAYTRHGSPSKLTMPDATGSFEIRYVVAQSKRTLTAREITLSPVSATLKVTNTPVPGGKIQVEWTGPGYHNDYITIVETGSPEGTFNKYAYARRESVVEFEVPKALGTFEVRYVIGKSKRTLARLEVELRVAKASVSAVSPVAAGSVVEVTWTGPKNSEDYIEIVTSGAAADARPVSAARTAQGSPLSLFAPDTAGDYEVRYKTRDTGKVLARTALKVE